MTDAKRDNNSVVTLIGVSSADGITPVTIYVDPVTHRILVNATGGSTPGGSNTQVQYNNNGVMGGITGATTDGTKLTLVAPVLGAATATSINGLIISTTTGTLTIANAKTVTINNTLTFNGTDASTIAFGGGGTVAYQGGTLAQFAATTSAQLAGVISDETGSGALVFATSPTLVTPVLGVATATSINGLTISTTTGTFTLANAKTFVVNNSITLNGTDSAVYTFPGATDTIMGLGATQTVTGPKTFNSGNLIFAGATSGTIILNATAVAGSNTLTLPAATDTLVGKATTDTLTNKTLTTPTITKPVMNATNPTAQTYSPSAASTATLDLSLSNQHYITMPAGNITIALSNDTNNQIFLVSILQDGTGSRTVTWFTTIRWAGGSAPTLTTTANKRDVFGFIRTGSGTYDGFVIGQNI